MERELMKNRKKMICELMGSDFYVPMKLKELAIFLDVPKEEREELEQVLSELMAEGRIEISKRGKYSKSEGRSLCGTFIGNVRGFGFVDIEGEEEDIFIPESQTNGAMDGDTVQVALAAQRSEDGRRREGVVVKILQRGITRVVGTFQKSKNFGFVVPDNVKVGQDVFIPLERSKGADRVSGAWIYGGERGF